ncbi:MAG: AMP-binding protein [Deltaproteobacteria bacterium]|jgi:phenylacetate-coenzyme A ligase PaaK-like adenylate-forming protein|nr:AMP-binding protein [Deltaproteobacteria bacterium]
MLPWLDREVLIRLKKAEVYPELSPEAEDNPLEVRKALELGLARFRLLKLAQTLDRAFNTVFYNSLPVLISGKLKESLLDTAKTPLPAPYLEEKLYQALDKLPLTASDQLAQAPEMFLAVSQSEVAGVVTVPTSGSTGPAKRIFGTSADLENTEDFYYFGMRNLVNPVLCDKVALLMSGQRPGSVGYMLTRALERWPIPISVPGFPPLGQPELTQWYEELIKYAPTCLVGVPAQVLALARHELAPELNESLRTILLSGDVAPRSLVMALEEELPGTKVFLHYGQTEFGLAGAVECRYHTGPHLREADLLLEIIDQDGKRLGPGQIGEMVITSLSREAMPLIRYKTGDLAALAVGFCPCGSVFRRIQTFGRILDRICWPDGYSLPLWKISEVLYGLPGVVGFKALSPEEPDFCLKLLVKTKNEAEPVVKNELKELLKGRKWEISFQYDLLEKGQVTGKQILYKSE